MNAAAAKHYSILTAVVVGTAAALSLLGGIPYIFTITGFTVWWFVGHLITADDDAPGGWSNPNGKVPFPWLALFLKGLLLVAAIGLALMPTVRELGARTT